MQFRDMTEADIPLLIEWLKQFSDELDYPGKAPISDEVAAGFFSRFIDSASNAAIIAEEHGKPIAALGFAIMPHPWTGKKILFKAFWYSAKPGAGMAVMRYVIDICKSCDVSLVVAGTMLANNSHIALERLGFEACETNYILDLEH